MISSRNIARKPAIQKAIGILAAEYLRFVYLTSRTTTLPSDIYERVAPDMPVIIAMWHGQHFLAPFIKRDGLKGKTLISRHRDGEINAIAAERLAVPMEANSPRKAASLLMSKRWRRLQQDIM